MLCSRARNGVGGGGDGCFILRLLATGAINKWWCKHIGGEIKYRMVTVIGGGTITCVDKCLLLQLAKRILLEKV